jgi:hypothetical protein
MIEGFLLGVVVTSSIAAAAFFYRFWRRTQDRLFLAFAAAFLIEGLNRLSFLFIEAPNEGSPAIYLVRLLAFLIILTAIVAKNRSTRA